MESSQDPNYSIHDATTGIDVNTVMHATTTPTSVEESEQISSSRSSAICSSDKVNFENSLVSENDPFFVELGAEFGISNKALFAFFQNVFVLPQESFDSKQETTENETLANLLMNDGLLDTLLDRFQHFHASCVLKIVIPSNDGVAQEFSFQEDAKAVQEIDFHESDSEYSHLSPSVIAMLMDSMEKLYNTFSGCSDAEKQKAFSLLQRIVVNLRADPSNEKYRSINLSRAKLLYQDEQFFQFYDFLENLGFGRLSSTPSNTESEKNMMSCIKESACKYAHPVTSSLSHEEPEEINSRKEKAIRLVVMRPVDAEFKELLEFVHFMILDIMGKSTAPGRQTSIPIIPSTNDQKGKHGLNFSKTSEKYSFGQSSPQPALLNIRNAKPRFRSEKLNEQLNEVRQLARDRHTRHHEFPESMPKTFTLRGMTPKETSKYIRTLETNEKLINRLQKIPLKNRSMSLRDFEKPIFDWKPENCEFYYSDKFRIQAGYRDLNNLTQMRQLMFTYEYVGRMALDYTNHYRKLHKLRQLEWNQDLMKIGVEHCDNMADFKVPVGHDGVAERFQKYPFVASRSGENVAFMQGIYEVAKTAVDGWIHSPGHEKNLRGDYTVCGISVSSRGSRFYLTQLFGSRA